MEIVKIGIIGVVAAILATFIKKDRAEFAMMMGIGTGVIIFYFVFI